MAVDVEQVFDTVYEGSGRTGSASRCRRGFTARQSVVVRSTEVALVEKMSREITELLEQGVTITSSAPLYYYTKLGEVKIEMLAEASRTRACGPRTWSRRPAGPPSASCEPPTWGSSTSTPPTRPRPRGRQQRHPSLEKDIITIVHVKYELE